MTITSNIHVGLPGWSNATYLVGARRSNGGQAYEVTTAGTSTAPPTGTGTNIAPTGTSRWKWLSAVNYSTLQDWADAIPSVLTEPIVGLVWNDATIAPALGTTVLFLGGHTTSSTNTITIRPAPGEGFRDKPPTTPFGFNVANGVCIQCPSTGSGGVNYILINDSNVVFEGIQFWDPNPASNSTIIAGSGQNIQITKCIFDGHSQPDGATIFGLSGNGSILVNCLVIDRGTTVDDTFHAFGASGVHILYNTFYAPTVIADKRVLDCGNNTTTGTNFARNNIFANFPRPFSAHSGTPWASDHNAYTAASFDVLNSGTDNGGSIYGISLADTFVIPGSDFHLKQGSPCIAAGLSDIIANDDAFGTLRPQPLYLNPFSSNFSSDFGAGGTSIPPDIGAHELLSVSVVFRDVMSPAELPGRSWSEWPGNTNWTSAIYSDATAAPEFMTPLSSTIFVPMDILAPRMLRDVSSPLAFSQLSQIPVRDAAISIDWTANLTTDKRLPFEWTLSVIGSTSVPSGSLSLFPSLSWLLSEFDPAEFDSDFGAFTFTIDPVFSLERGSSTSALQSFPIFSSSSLVKAVSAPVDWTQISTLSTSHTVGIDWLAPVSGAQSSPIDWSIPVIMRDIEIPGEWRSGVVANASASLAPMASASVDTSGNTDWLSPVARSVSAHAGHSATILGDWTFQYTLDARTVQDVRFTDEWGSSLGASAEYPFELSGITRSVDITVPAAWFSITTTSVSSGYDFSYFQSWDWVFSAERTTTTDVLVSGALESTSLISASSAGNIDWDQLLLSIHIDAAFTVETLHVLQKDITIGIPVLLGRRSIGSHLTPDEWEEQNNPCS